MIEFFAKLLDTSDFSRRWDCGNWPAALGWLHILSDLATWGAYLAIPLILAVFVRRRRDMPFPGLFVLFGLFILTCGTVHLLDAVSFWAPLYRLSGLVKLLTALASWGAVAALVPAVPRVLALRSRRALEQEADERMARLRESQARIRAIVEMAADAILTVDGEGRIDSFNPAAQLMFGYSDDEAIGRSVRALIPNLSNSDEPAVGDLRTGERRSGKLADLVTGRRKDGTLFEADLAISKTKLDNQPIFVVLVRDATERRRAEKERAQLLQRAQTAQADAEASEQRYRLLIEAIPPIVWTARPDGWFDYYNQRWFDYTGLTLEETEGWGWKHVLHPQDLGPCLDRWKQAVRAGDTFQIEYRFRRADGSYRWHLGRALPLRYPDGTIVKWFGTCTDIDDQKRAEEAQRFLAEASTLLNASLDEVATLQSIAQLTVPHLADWCAVDLVENDRSVRRVAMVHADPARVELAEEVQRRYPDNPQSPYGIATVIAKGEPQLIEEVSDPLLRQLAQDHQHFWLLKELGLRSVALLPLQARGRALGVITFATAESGRRYRPSEMTFFADLAHRSALAVDNARLYREAQDAIQRKEESLALLDTLMKSAPVGLAFVDRDLRYVRLNDALAAIDGVRADTVLGKTMSEVVPTLAARLEPLYHSVLETGQPVINRELSGPTAGKGDGERHWLVSYYPVQRPGGPVLGVGVVIAEITERKRLENEARQTALELAEADRRKDEFLAMLAHELRNPLAPIRNAVQLLQRAGADATLRDQASQMLERQLLQLTRLVDDLLDVSRITRGKIQLQQEVIPLAAVVERAVETSRPLIDEHRHQLTITLPPEPVYLYADLTRVAQVLSNLLNNAAKYTERGGCIALTAARAGADVVIRIRDNGIGMTPQMQRQAFDLFVQAEQSLDRSRGGLGIGLTLVRTLVELHGGTVAAASAGPGLGSEFSIRLPALTETSAPVVAPPKAPAEQAAMAPQRILVVDDNRDAADSLALLLRLSGHDVRAVHSAEAALALAPEFNPSVVFLDIGLPGMDGYQVAKRLRHDLGLKQVLLVAITGYGQPEDRRHSHEAGIDYHLVKPVAPEELEAVLRTRGAAPG